MQEIKQLIFEISKNKKALRMLSAEQRDAIIQIAHEQEKEDIQIAHET